MGLIIPPDLISSLKNKYLLLDTNIFIDASKHPADFSDFFNVLKSEDLTLVTIDCVKIEFLRGAPNDEKYKEKEEFFDDITKFVLPVDKEVIDNTYKLVKRYKEAGGTIHFTDLFLGATLMRYKSNIYLFSRNINELPASIFDLEFIINYPINKGIFTYGIYKIKSD
jgi:predicted nucleic acid-binding protein